MRTLTVLSLAFLGIFAVNSANAQNGYSMPASTTLASAQNSSSTQLCLTSTTNIFAPALNVGTISGQNVGTSTVLVDAELETVIGAPNAGCFQVRRGFPNTGYLSGLGRAVGHNSGATATIGLAAQFFSYVPNGACTAATEQILPRVVTVDFNFYNCPTTGPYANTWVVSGHVGAYTNSSTNLNPNTIQFVSVPLTLTQLQTMYTTPVAVIPAQGAGTLIEVQSCTLDLKYGSAAFTSGGTVTIGYGTTESAVATTAAAATIASTVLTTFSASQTISVAGALAVSANSLTTNLPVSITNATAVFAGGTGATGVLDCAYRVHSGQ